MADMIRNPLTSVVEKLFTYLTTQKNHLAKLNYVSREMDEAFVSLMLEINKYLFQELEKNTCQAERLSLGITSDPVSNERCISKSPPTVFQSIQQVEDSSEIVKIEAFEEDEEERMEHDTIHDKENSQSSSRIIEENNIYLAPKPRENGFENGQTITVQQQNSKNATAQNSAETFQHTDFSDKYVMGNFDTESELSEGNDVDAMNEDSNTAEDKKTKLIVVGSFQHKEKRKLPHGYPCTMCDKILKSVNFYRNHLSKVHHIESTEPTDFKCDICDKILLSYSSLRDHMSIHTGEKRYKCSDCDKTFLYRAEKSRHRVKYHSDISNKKL